jgi:hypothetical protein
MAHKNTIRTEKDCLNCGNIVENRFCPNCGQENTETNKSFRELLFHFFEDITHYESSFWGTIKNLMFRPAYLSLEYLSGKRISYLTPIRLYLLSTLIFFFALSISNSSETLGEYQDGEWSNFIKHKPSVEEASIIKLVELHKIDKNIASTIIMKIGDPKKLVPKNLNYDSIPKPIDNSNKFLFFTYHNYIDDYINKKAFELRKKYSTREVSEKFGKSLYKNLSKTLLVFIPFFALGLLLFHDKKKWTYFEHAIFTLHCFSFFLLLSVLIMVLGNLSTLFTKNLSNYFNLLFLISIVIYFFIAHFRFYKEKKAVSFVKSVSVILISIPFFLLILNLFAALAMVSMH